MKYKETSVSLHIQDILQMQLTEAQTEIVKLKEQLKKADSVIVFAETAIDHALHLGYVGSGSTEGLFKDALKLARQYLKSRGE